MSFPLRTSVTLGEIFLAHLEIEIQSARVRGEEEIDKTAPGFCFSFSG
jgi:hypothetical protein